MDGIRPSPATSGRARFNLTISNQITLGAASIVGISELFTRPWDGILLGETVFKYV